MASIPAPAPVTIPGPLSWWQKPKVRRRVIAALVLVGAYVLGLSYGAWTRVCAGEHCPSISRLVANPNHQVQTSKVNAARSEEHTSELQSLAYLVCRLLLEKKKKKNNIREKQRQLKKKHDTQLTKNST